MLLFLHKTALSLVEKTFALAWPIKIAYLSNLEISRNDKSVLLFLWKKSEKYAQEHGPSCCNKIEQVQFIIYSSRPYFYSFK